ncbi:protein phosphatase [Bacillus horti]|uniref:Protein phosphatase n=2 Tax=Caldalkalibacillus horti TaxID=77523 RepID=A0ABT9W4G8_9BACI|nr:protein phosphatase [Bacillus horti]
MYDIIGDVHGCYAECIELLDKLGYVEEDSLYLHPEGRLFILVGDITDRGPNSVAMIDFVVKHVRAKKALYVPGNHCNKLYRFLLGRDVQITHGLETTVAELSKLPRDTKKQVQQDFIKLYESAPWYLTLDDGQLIVAHAGIRKDYIGEQHKGVKFFCLYGDVTGEKDETGFPIRKDWAQEYDGDSWIIYGHTPVRQPRMINKTVNIDTGCVFGGHLTGLRYPEFTFEKVPSSLPSIDEKFRLD